MIKSPGLSEIRELIGKNEMRDALQLLFDNYYETSKDFHHEFLLVLNNYNRLSREQIKGIISRSEFNVEYNKLVNSFLELVSFLESSVKNKHKDHQNEHSLSIVIHEKEFDTLLFSVFSKSSQVLINNISIQVKNWYEVELFDVHILGKKPSNHYKFLVEKGLNNYKLKPPILGLEPGVWTFEEGEVETFYVEFIIDQKYSFDIVVSINYRDLSSGMNYHIESETFAYNGILCKNRIGIDYPKQLNLNLPDIIYRYYTIPKLQDQLRTNRNELVKVLSEIDRFLQISQRESWEVGTYYSMNSNEILSSIPDKNKKSLLHFLEKAVHDFNELQR